MPVRERTECQYDNHCSQSVVENAVHHIAMFEVSMLLLLTLGYFFFSDCEI